MKKLVKISVLVMIFIIMIMAFQKVNAQSFIREESCVKIASIDPINTTIERDTSMDNIISKVFGVVAYICYGVAIVVLLIKGVQFMSAAPEGKAEIKKQMIAVTIGAVIIFSIRTIIMIISNFTNNLLG